MRKKKHKENICDFFCFSAVCSNPFICVCQNLVLRIFQSIDTISVSFHDLKKKLMAQQKTKFRNIKHDVTMKLFFSK